MPVSTSKDAAPHEARGTTDDGSAGRWQMARIFVTGSADGLGRAAAETLLGGGHEVIVHARSPERLAVVEDLVIRGASGVVGDLADLNQTQAVADQVN